MGAGSLTEGVDGRHWARCRHWSALITLGRLVVGVLALLLRWAFGGERRSLVAAAAASWQPPTSTG